MDKIILIRPLFPKFLQPNPPIGLGYLAAVLEKEGYKIFIIDCGLLNISYNKVIEYLIRINPLLIGISSMTVHYNEMKKLSRSIKEHSQLKNIPIVLGGVHVSFLPEESLKECNADFVIIGEGERTICELSNALRDKASLNEIKGLVFKSNGEIKINKPRELIENIDELPLPAWHLIPPDIYPQDPHGHEYIRAPYAPILTTRGCPYKCTYCASTNLWGNKFRRRNPKYVVDEIELLVERYGVREIHIWDDNFTLNKKHVLDICDELLKRKLDIKLKCPNGVRIDTLDEGILLKMKTTGFYQITIAVESGSQRVLDSVNKKLDLKRVPKVVKLLRKIGIVSRGFFILGLPAETINSLHETLQYSSKLGLDFASFFIAQPIPGSKIFEKWRKTVNLQNWDWSDIDYAVKGQNLSKIDPKVLIKFRNRAYLTFFLRPRTIYVYLKHITMFFHWLMNVIRQLLRRFIGHSI